MVKIFDNGSCQSHEGELDVSGILNDFNNRTELTNICIERSNITPEQCVKLSKIFTIPNIQTFDMKGVPLENDTCVQNLFGNNNFKYSQIKIVSVLYGCELTRTGLNTIVEYLPDVLDLLALECNDINTKEIDGIVEKIANGQRLLGTVYLYSKGKRYHRQYSNEGVLGTILLGSYDTNISQNYYENYKRCSMMYTD